MKWGDLQPGMLLVSVGNQTRMLVLSRDDAGQVDGWTSLDLLITYPDGSVKVFGQRVRKINQDVGWMEASDEVIQKCLRGEA